MESFIYNHHNKSNKNNPTQSAKIIGGGNSTEQSLLDAMGENIVYENPPQNIITLYKNPPQVINQINPDVRRVIIQILNNALLENINNTKANKLMMALVPIIDWKAKTGKKGLNPWENYDDWRRKKQSEDDEWDYDEISVDTPLYRGTSHPYIINIQPTYYSPTISKAAAYLGVSDDDQVSLGQVSTYLQIVTPVKTLKLFRLDSLKNINKMLNYLKGNIQINDAFRKMLKLNTEDTNITKIIRNSGHTWDFEFLNWMCGNLHFDGYSAGTLPALSGNFLSEVALCKPSKDLQIQLAVQSDYISNYENMAELLKIITESLYNIPRGHINHINSIKEIPKPNFPPVKITSINSRIQKLKREPKNTLYKKASKVNTDDLDLEDYRKDSSVTKELIRRIAEYEYNIDLQKGPQKTTPQQPWFRGKTSKTDHRIENTLTVVTINVYMGILNPFDQLLDQLKNTGFPDVVCIQEAPDITTIINSDIYKYYSLYMSEPEHCRKDNLEICQERLATLIYRASLWKIKSVTKIGTNHCPTERVTQIISLSQKNKNIKIGNIHLCGGKNDDTKVLEIGTKSDATSHINYMKADAISKLQNTDIVLGGFNSILNYQENKQYINYAKNTLKWNDMYIHAWNRVPFDLLAKMGFDRVNYNHNTTVLNNTSDHIWYKPKLILSEFYTIDMNIFDKEKQNMASDHNGILATFLT